MTSVVSAVKDAVSAVSDTKKINDLRHNTREPYHGGADAKERMRTDHGTKIAEPENWYSPLPDCYQRQTLNLVFSFFFHRVGFASRETAKRALPC